MRKRNTKGDCKVQTLAFEIITPLNECTGRLSRVSTRHKHNRRGMPMLSAKFQVTWPFGSADEAKTDVTDGRHLGFLIGTILDIFLSSSHRDASYQFSSKLAFGSGEEAKYRFSRWLSYSDHLGFVTGIMLAIFNLQVTPMLPEVSSQFTNSHFWFRSRNEK